MTVAAIIGLILIHLGIGTLTSFIVMYVAYRDGWNTDDRQAASVVAIPMWPLVLPVMLFRQIYSVMDNKAEQLGRKH